MHVSCYVILHEMSLDQATYIVTHDEELKRLTCFHNKIIIISILFIEINVSSKIQENLTDTCLGEKYFNIWRLEFSKSKMERYSNNTIGYVGWTFSFWVTSLNIVEDIQMLTSRWKLLNLYFVINDVTDKLGHQCIRNHRILYHYIFMSNFTMIIENCQYVMFVKTF